MPPALRPRIYFLIFLAACFSLMGKGAAQDSPTEVEAADDGMFTRGFRWWETSGNVVMHHTDPMVPPYVNDAMVLFNGVNSAPNGVISQTFGTVVGATYTVTFQMGIYSFNTTEQKLRVIATGATERLNQLIARRGTGTGERDWTLQTFTFVADSTTTTLAFRDASPGTAGIDLLLDAVSVMGPKAANRPPVAKDDYCLVTAGERTRIWSGSLVGNDMDSFGINLTVNIAEPPAHGTLEDDGDGNLYYTPEPGFTGFDSFRYRANDGELDSEPAVVVLDVVTKGNFANRSFEFATLKGGVDLWSLTGNVSVESSPPYQATDGQKLIAFNAVNKAPGGYVEAYISTVVGQTYRIEFDQGVLGYNTNRQSLKVTEQYFTGKFGMYDSEYWSEVYDIDAVGGGVCRWIPRSYTFYATRTDTRIRFTDVSTTTENIDQLLDNVRCIAQGPVNYPPQGTNDAYEAFRDVPLVVPVHQGVLANDTDANDDVLTAELQSMPLHGTLSFSPDGSFAYTPDEGYAGWDWFSYYCKDGSPTTNQFSVSIMVNAPATQKFKNGDLRLGNVGWGSSLEFGSSVDDGSGETVWHVAMTGSGNISQTIHTVIGRKYRISFDALNRGMFSRSMRVYLPGTYSWDPSKEFIVPVAPQPAGHPWKRHEVTFTAWLSETTVQLNVLPAGAQGPVMLANLRMTDVTAVEGILASSSMAGNPGSLSISVNSTDSGSFVLERSPDLQQWSTVARKVLIQSGPVIFTESEIEPPTGTDPCFYRIGIEGAE